MGTMTKWPVQKHTEHHKTRIKQRRNRHKEITIFCVFSTLEPLPLIKKCFPLSLQFCFLLLIVFNFLSYIHYQTHNALKRHCRIT